MPTLDILNEYLRIVKPTTDKLRLRLTKEAEDLSERSDISELYLKTPPGTFVQKVFDLLIMQLVLPYCSKNLVESTFRTKYAREASRQEEGQWRNLLLRISKTKNYHTAYLLDYILEDIGTEAFFGILIPYCKSKRTNGFSIRGKPFDAESKRKVFRPQRKRGYSDKGSTPSFKQKQMRLIREEEAKEEPERRPREVIELIPPRRWWKPKFRR